MSDSADTAEFIYRALTTLPTPKAAMEALTTVNCAMLMKLAPPDRVMDHIQVRIMMGEMTDAVVKVWEMQMQAQQKDTVQ